MPDYSKALIYTIKSYNNSIYVGSTINFRTRKNHHKCNIYNENKLTYNLKLYKTIRENDGKWDMKLYKQFPCENKTQLAIEEERIRCDLNADLNTISCWNGLDEKSYKREYNIKNKEKLAEQKREYNIKNKEKIAEHKHKSYHKNKETLIEIQKQYYQKNKEQIAERKKQHYQENRQKILEQHKEKVTCDCGCVVTKFYLSKHKKSKKHQELINI